MERSKREIDAYRSVLNDTSKKNSSTSSIPPSGSPPKPTDGETEESDSGDAVDRHDTNTPGTRDPRKQGPQSDEGFLKTGSDSTEKFRKVAKFLLLIGKQATSEILPFLSKGELDIVAKEMSRIDKIDEDEAGRILREFGQKTPSKRTGEGGPETAREILHSAFGEESGEKLFNRAVPFGGRTPFDFLADLDVEQLTLLLRKESIPVLSIVLPHIDSNSASKVLEALPPDTQKDLVKRMAKIQRIHPDAVATTEDGLRERLRKLGAADTEEIDGVSALVEILRKMDPSGERAILAHLSETVPEVSETIRKRLFSLESLAGLSRKDLERVLRDFEDKELALVLKGRNDETIEMVLAGVSQRRREVIREDMVGLGAVRRGDIETATQEFLEHVRGMAEKGDIHLADKDDMYV